MVRNRIRQRPTRKPSSSSRAFGTDADENPHRRKSNMTDEQALNSKNARMAKELSELRVRLRDEVKTVAKLTMDNMKLLSQCREQAKVIDHLREQIFEKQQQQQQQQPNTVRNGLSASQQQQQRKPDMPSNSPQPQKSNKHNAAKILPSPPSPSELIKSIDQQQQHTSSRSHSKSPRTKLDFEEEDRILTQLIHQQMNNAAARSAAVTDDSTNNDDVDMPMDEFLEETTTASSISSASRMNTFNHHSTSTSSSSSSSGNKRMDDYYTGPVSSDLFVESHHSHREHATDILDNDDTNELDESSSDEEDDHFSPKWTEIIHPTDGYDDNDGNTRKSEHAAMNGQMMMMATASSVEDDTRGSARSALSGSSPPTSPSTHIYHHHNDQLESDVFGDFIPTNSPIAFPMANISQSSPVTTSRARGADTSTMQAFDESFETSFPPSFSLNESSSSNTETPPLLPHGFDDDDDDDLALFEDPFFSAPYNSADTDFGETNDGLFATTTMMSVPEPAPIVEEKSKHQEQPSSPLHHSSINSNEHFYKHNIRKEESRTVASGVVPQQSILDTDKTVLSDANLHNNKNIPSSFPKSTVSIKRQQFDKSVTTASPGSLSSPGKNNNSSVRPRSPTVGNKIVMKRRPTSPRLSNNKNNNNNSTAAAFFYSSSSKPISPDSIMQDLEKRDTNTTGCEEGDDNQNSRTEEEMTTAIKPNRNIKPIISARDRYVAATLEANMKSRANKNFSASSPAEEKKSNPPVNMEHSPSLVLRRIQQRKNIEKATSSKVSQISESFERNMRLNEDRSSVEQKLVAEHFV